MSKEIVEAVHVLEREKGISSERLMLALEDALLSAYKKQPGAAKYARVDMDRESADFKVFELLIPPELEEQLLAEVEVEEPDRRPRDRRDARARGAGDRPGAAGRVLRSDRRARRHARRLRPHRRPDRQAGDPPADPRGRARHDVRRVPGPRRRADHRHRPAVRLALHARAAARARRGAAAQVRAGRQRALRARRPHQGRHHRRLEPGEGPEHHRLAPLARADQEAVRTRGAGDRRLARRDPERRARARLPLEDRGRLARQRRRSRRRLRRPARLARAHGRVRAARREDRHHPLQRGARPLRRQGALARARARGARRRRARSRPRSSCRTTSSRWRSARRGRTPAWPPASPAGGSTSGRRPSSPRKRRRWTTTRRRCPGRCAAILSNGKRCPNAALPGSRYCGLPAHQALADQEGDEVAPGRGRRGRAGRRGASRSIEEGADEVVAEAAGHRGARGRPDEPTRGRGLDAEHADLQGEPDTPSGAADSITPHDGESVTSQTEAPGTDPHPEDAEIAQDLGVADATASRRARGLRAVRGGRGGDRVAARRSGAVSAAGARARRPSSSASCSTDDGVEPDPERRLAGPRRVPVPAPGVRGPRAEARADSNVPSGPVTIGPGSIDLIDQWRKSASTR